MSCLITKGEAAEILRVSRRTITRYVAAGWLIPIRLTSKTLRFDIADVQRLINSKLVQSNDDSQPR